MSVVSGIDDSSIEDLSKSEDLVLGVEVDFLYLCSKT